MACRSSNMQYGNRHVNRYSLPTNSYADRTFEMAEERVGKKGGVRYMSIGKRKSMMSRRVWERSCKMHKTKGGEMRMKRIKENIESSSSR